MIGLLLVAGLILIEARCEISGEEETGALPKSQTQRGFAGWKSILREKVACGEGANRPTPASSATRLSFTIIIIIIIVVPVLQEPI
jgi:hypothetical protein